MQSVSDFWYAIFERDWATTHKVNIIIVAVYLLSMLAVLVSPSDTLLLLFMAVPLGFVNLAIGIPPYTILSMMIGLIIASIIGWIAQILWNKGRWIRPFIIGAFVMNSCGFIYYVLSGMD